MTKRPDWLRWARELQALSQTGLHFAEGSYDRERYERLGQIAAEIVAAHTTLEVGTILELNAREFGYATPKVDVRGVVFRDDRILLVQEAMDAGRWTVPGGWADVNETPSEAVEREVFEESGLRTRATKLLSVGDRERQGHQPPFPYHVYKVAFRCEWIGGSLCSDGSETTGAAFFTETDLPELSVSRVTRAQIERFFLHHRNPERPADFD
ncbi:MAG: NUDIX hydrolase N-terminal domain-containing protein [Verrucomicrobia bacterium]|nr:NUDIX hydrolase N-terminal domain-containing protein [Verrucomicrobiota bacterium]